MEIRDGFIVAVHEYCDRWCERCAFTSYCRVFAAEAEAEASFDPNMRPIVDAPVREGRSFPALWIDDDEPAPLPGVPPERQAIDDLALAYVMKIHERLPPRDDAASKAEPRQTIARFAILIAMKVHRALMVWPDDGPADPPGTTDQDGSAKTALIAIDRSHVAWGELLASGAVSEAEAAPFVAHLTQLRETLEKIRPHAHRFIRPAFDEPHELARLTLI